MERQNDVDQHTVEVGATPAGAWAVVTFLSILVICVTVIIVVALAH